MNNYVVKDDVIKAVAKAMADTRNAWMPEYWIPLATTAVDAMAQEVREQLSTPEEERINWGIVFPEKYYTAPATTTLTTNTTNYRPGTIHDETHQKIQEAAKARQEKRRVDLMDWVANVHDAALPEDWRVPASE